MRRCAVQIAGRLVRQNQGRVVDQCPCDGNALLLASRQLGRPMSRAIHEPDAPEQLHGSVMTLASRYTGIDERQLDVSRRGQSRQKIEVLEHEPDPTLANPAQLIVIQSPDLRPQNR